MIAEYAPILSRDSNGAVHEEGYEHFTDRAITVAAQNRVASCYNRKL